tara:strand:+ start:6964 stop:7527 length:564 start_codon:yes stop_codon:yes gene_type:complete
MKSPYSFIVTPVKDRRYDNLKQIGDIEFITSVSEEDHTASNRFASVVETPIHYTGPIQKGDTLLVHHNVFKFYNDMQGRRKSGRSHLKENLFLVDSEQFYMYKKKDKWHAWGKYCFIKPASLKESYIFKATNEEPLFGTIKYINEELIALGVKEGDSISYTPGSEYPFIVDDEKLYRMFTNNITMIV